MARRTVRLDKIQVDIEINGKKVKNEYKSLGKEAAILRQKIKGLEVGTEAWIKANRDLNKVNDRMREARRFAARLGREQTALGKISTRVGGLMRQAFSPLGSLFAGIGVGRLGSELLNQAEDLETFRSKTNRVFGEATADVERYAKVTATSLGLTQQQYVNTATKAGDLLIPMGFQREEAARLSSNLVNLSGALSEWSVGQFDATEVNEILTQAMLGQRERLLQLGISIKEVDVQARLAANGQSQLTGKALEQAKAMATLQLITEKSADAQEEFRNGAGSLTRMKAQVTAAIKTQAEAWVSDMIPAFRAGLQFVGRLVGANQQYSETLRREQVELNVLVGRIAEMNEGNEERAKLVAQLNRDYPKFLGNLDAEKVSNEQLVGRLKEVNDQYVNRILIQRKQEAIEDRVNIAANSRERQVEREQIAREKLQDIQTEFSLQIEKSLSLTEKYAEAERQLTAQLDQRGKRGLGRFFSDQNRAVEELNQQMQLYNGYLDTEQNMLSEANELTKEREDLIRDLGLTQVAAQDASAAGGVGGVGGGRGGRGTGPDAATQKVIQKRIELEREAAIAINKLRVELLEDGIEKQIALLELGAAEQLEKLQGSEAQKDEQRLLIESKLQRDIIRMRRDFTGQRVKEVQDAAKAEIEALEGTEVEKVEARRRIEQRVQTEVLTIIQEGEEEITETAVRQANVLREAVADVVISTQSRVVEIERKTQEQIAEIRRQNLSDVDESTAVERVRREAQLRIETLQQIEESSTESRISTAQRIQNQLIEVERKTQEQIAEIRRQNLSDVDESTAVERVRREAQLRIETLQQIEESSTESRISTAQRIQNQLIEVERKTQEQIAEIRRQNLSDVDESTAIDRVRREAQLRIETLQQIEESSTESRISTAQRIQNQLIEIERKTQEQIRAIQVGEGSQVGDVQAQVEAIRAAAETKRQAVIEEQSSIQSLLVQLETRTQSAIADINTTEDESVKNERIEAIRQAAEVERQTIIQTVLETAEVRTNVERDLTTQLVQAKIESATRIQTAEQEARTQTLSAEQQLYEERLASSEAFYQQKTTQAVEATISAIAQGDDQAEAQERLQKRITDIALDELQARKALQEEFGLSTVEIEQEIADAQLAIASEKSAELANIDQERLQRIAETAGQVGQVLNGLIDLEAQSARQETNDRLSDLKRKKDAEIKAAGDNADAKEKIEKRYAAKEESIRLEAARREKEIALKKATIDVTLSILKAAASAPPPLNAPAISFASILGAIQLASIASQQFAEGGFTGSGSGIAPDASGQKPVGVVHANEWVANRGMVSDPVTGPMIRSLETLRQRYFATGTGSVPIWETTRSVPSNLPGYAEGGFAVPSATPSDVSVTAVGPTLDFSTIEGLLEEQTSAIRGINLRIGEYEAGLIGELQHDLDKKRTVSRLG